MTILPRPYHHGDLRAALLIAAEAELIEKGVERFTLRGVARRAGVSHAAPAHHFRDTDAMLTALAARGFERFLASLRAQVNETWTPRERLAISGVGYILFALENPALFRLMFGSERPQSDDANLVRSAMAAFDDLVSRVGAIRGDDPMQSQEGKIDVASAWANVHGLATLLIDGRLTFLEPLLGSARSETLRRLVERGMPTEAALPG